MPEDTSQTEMRRNRLRLGVPASSEEMPSEARQCATDSAYLKVDDSDLLYLTKYPLFDRRIGPRFTAKVHVGCPCGAGDPLVSP